MVKHVNISNCIKMWRFGEQLSLKKLSSRAYNIVVFNFNEIVNRGQSELLTKQELIQLLPDDRLNIENEDSLYQVVVQWLKADEENRKNEFLRMVSSIRFPLCSRDTWVHALLDHLECSDITKEALGSQYHQGEVHLQNA